MKTKNSRIFFWAGLIMLGCCFPSLAQTGFQLLHSFSNATNDGAYPSSGVTLYSNIVYGVATSGGSSGNGAVYQVNTNGSGESLLASMNPSVGIDPGPELLAYSNSFFGTAPGGGFADAGTVFRVGLDGSIVALHQFSATPFYTNIDGGSPMGGLIVASNTLYGTTSYGGLGGQGVIFSMGTDGSAYTIIHAFSPQLLADGSSVFPDGANPKGALLPLGSRLYGAAFYGGGDSQSGTIFGMDVTGSNFSVLYQFAGTQDGANPNGDLVSDGVSLYGTAGAAGMDNYGVVFAVDLTGTNYRVLHSFARQADGEFPAGPVVVSGTNLYGLITYGGVNGVGNIYTLHTDGSGFQVLYSFTNGVDGANPMGRLSLAGNTLYGTTSEGGAHQNGTLFSFALNPFLQIIPPSQAGGNATVVWPLTAYNYSLQYSTNLAATNWTTITSGVRNTGYVFEYIPSTTNGAKFFRLKSN